MCSSSFKGLSQATWRRRNHGGVIGGAAVFPVRGVRLRIEVDHYGDFTGLGRSHG
jgi:hypothetical protein